MMLSMLVVVVEAAAGIRARAGEWEPAFSTSRIVEQCYPGTFVTGGNLPPGIDEMITMTPDGPIITYQRKLPGPMQRFVIAHALGHLVFNDFTQEQATNRHLYDPVVEERADAFAAELLAPMSLVAKFVQRMPSSDPEEHEIYLDHVDEIASRFAVPADVIDSRIRSMH